MRELTTVEGLSKDRLYLAGTFDIKHEEKRMNVTGLFECSDIHSQKWIDNNKLGW